MRFFNEVYRSDPPWEIGGPQPEFVRRCDADEIRGRVLDVGCGTGENAAYFAARGHPTVGVDFAPRAIERARGKFGDRGLPLTFQVANALELSSLGATFDTVTDCGLFHTLLDKHRPTYSASVRSVLRPRGIFWLLCFRDDEPTDWGGPRRITERELRETFAVGWKIRTIERTRFDVTLPNVEGRAWIVGFEPTPIRADPASRPRPDT